MREFEKKFSFELFRLLAHPFILMLLTNFVKSNSGNPCVTSGLVTRTESVHHQFPVAVNNAITKMRLCLTLRSLVLLFYRQC